MGADETDALRAAKNEVLFRQVNERIEALNEAFNPLLPVGEWVCECADDSCIERIEMTLSEYETLRGHPAHFAVLPGHQVVDIERVVEERERYVIVEKVGAAADLAAAEDPRSGGSFGDRRTT